MKIKHVDEPGATTFAAFAYVTARYVRWQVTVVRPGRSPNVGGQSIEFFAAAAVDAAPRGIGITAHALPIVQTAGTPPAKLTQPLKVVLDYPYAEPLHAAIRITGHEPRPVDLTFGSQTLDSVVETSDAPRPLAIDVEAGGEKVAAQAVTLPPLRTLDGLHPAPLAHRHRLYGDPDRHRGEAGQQPAAGHGRRPPHGQLSRGRAVSSGMSRCSGRPISSSSGCRPRTAADFFEAVKQRPGGAQRDVPERADRPVPAGGIAAAVPFRHATGASAPACRWTRR